MYEKQKGESTAGTLAGLTFVGIFVAAWFTHIIVSISAAKWGLLIAGAILFPIGIVHGIGVWFGAW